MIEILVKSESHASSKQAQSAKESEQIDESSVYKKTPANLNESKKKVEAQRCRKRLEATENANTQHAYETLKLHSQRLLKTASTLAVNLQESEKKLKAAMLENCALKSGYDHGSESQMKRDNTRLAQASLFNPLDVSTTAILVDSKYHACSDQAQPTNESEQINESSMDDGTNPCIPERTAHDHLGQPADVGSNETSEYKTIAAVQIQEQKSVVGDCVTAIMSSSNLTYPETKIRLDQRWKQMFERLERFRAQTGHCQVPSKQDKALRAWVLHQRSRLCDDVGYKKARVDALNGIGFDWGQNHPFDNVSLANGTPSDEVHDGNFREAKWTEMFQRLKCFHAAAGHCCVSRKQEHKVLEAWTGAQRRELQDCVGNRKEESMH